MAINFGRKYTIILICLELIFEDNIKSLYHHSSVAIYSTLSWIVFCFQVIPHLKNKFLIKIGQDLV